MANTEENRRRQSSSRNKRGSPASRNLIRTNSTPNLPEVIDLGDGKYDIQPAHTIQPNRFSLPAPVGASIASDRNMNGEADSEHKYVRRWVQSMSLERSGEIKFTIMSNDGTRERSILLLELVNSLARQLPNMPRAYIVRLVFDLQHENIMLQIRNKDLKYIVIGGACYRPFHQFDFAELAFLAVKTKEQNVGYGARLMQHTKERVKALKLSAILTCADKHAVPYFRKQGFTDKVQIARDIYGGVIKDYSDVTLMQCTLYKPIDYLNVPPLVKSWKIALNEKMKEVSMSHVVYPGIDFSKNGGKRIDRIPGIENVVSEADLPSPSHLTEQTRQELLSIIDRMLKDEDSDPFREPVDPIETGALDYYERIANPIDLGTIRKRLVEGKFYVTKEMFVADMKRIFENCREYNGKNHVITQMGNKLEKFFLSRM